MIFTFGSKIYRYDDNPTLPADSTVRPVADLRFGRSGRNSTRYMGSLGSISSTNALHGHTNTIKGC